VIAGFVLALSLAVAGCSSDEPTPPPDGVPAGSETGGTTGDGGNQGGTTENPVPPNQPGGTTP
jgi:hypothetical protein